MRCIACNEIISDEFINFSCQDELCEECFEAVNECIIEDLEDMTFDELSEYNYKVNKKTGWQSDVRKFELEQEHEQEQA